MSWIAKGEGLSRPIAVVRSQPTGIVKIGDSTEKLPAPVLPAAGKAVPALLQDSPHDLINGWLRVKIAGLLSTKEHWDGVVCAISDEATHWVHISAAEAVSVQSFLTPRLITFLEGAPTADSDAIDDTMSHPDRLAAKLRTAQLLKRDTAITGHLMGAEIVAAKAYWLGRQVAVIGDGVLAQSYAGALAAQGCPVEVIETDLALDRGLAAVAQALGLEG